MKVLVMKWSADIFKNYGSKIGLILIRSFEIFIAFEFICFLLCMYMALYSDWDK